MAELDRPSCREAADRNPVRHCAGTSLFARPGPPSSSCPDYSQCLLALTGGKAIAVFADNGTAEDMVKKQPSLKIMIPDPAIFVHDVSYGVRADIDDHSLQTVNITIKNQVMSGKISRAFAAVGYLDIEQLLLTDMVLK